MNYREFKDAQVSLYGMGCMRLPVIDGDSAKIDEEQLFKMVDYAIDQGVNYFDTAWAYHSGQSEIAMGRALARHPRESFLLADKFPGYDSANWGKTAEIFEEQLRKCQVDYFDFYLFHNVCEVNIDAYLDDAKYGTFSYLMEQKRNGRIKHLGFSVHGTTKTTERFLEAYGKDMDFCQIQLNYLDYEFQDAKAKLRLAKEYNLPVICMEPLRGGRLVNLSEKQEDMLRAARPDEGNVAWALRYLTAQPQVLTILCGSSSFEQAKENIAVLSDDKPLSEAELEVLEAVAKNMIAGDVSPCTGCRYCVDHCPQGIDIPRMLELYAEHKFTGGGFLAPFAIGATPEGQRPEDCLQCGACSEVCPQQIDIPGELEKFTELLKG